MIELSITLIIIGFIIGGILAGQELIAQARVRNLIKDITGLQASVNTFKAQYNFLPGDFPKAGAILTSSTCANAPFPSDCNGDWLLGDMRSTGSKLYIFWQHLNLAGFLSYPYTGINNSFDLFKSSYNSQALIVRQFMSLQGDGNNSFEIGSWDAIYSVSDNGLTTPQDAYAVDLKIDDGSANSGHFLAQDRYNNNIPSGGCSYPPSSSTGISAYNLKGT